MARCDFPVPVPPISTTLRWSATNVPVARSRTEHHLLALAHIRPGEHHAAVAESDMRDLDRRRHAADQHDLMAPVELVGLAGRIVERHVGFGRR